MLIVLEIYITARLICAHRRVHSNRELQIFYLKHPAAGLFKPGFQAQDRRV
jgi:hypothetical protein